MTDWDSEYYKTHALAQERSGREMIDSHLFSGEERILDLGCGDGKLTYYLASKVPSGEVVGLDISEAMIAQAQQDYADVANLSFVKVGAEEFVFDQPFDLIMSFNALHWVKDHAEVLARSKKSLKPGGEILFFMVSGRGDPRIRDILLSERWKPYVRGLDERYNRMNELDYEVLLDQLGFKKDLVEIREFAHHYPTQEALADHFMTWLPYAMNLSSERCRDLATEISENIANGRSTDVVYKVAMLVIKAHLSASSRT